jgi:hypothetical protein
MDWEIQPEANCALMQVQPLEAGVPGDGVRDHLPAVDGVVRKVTPHEACRFERRVLGQVARKLGCDVSLEQKLREDGCLGGAVVGHVHG